MGKNDRYVCQQCGNVTPTWNGKCNDCGTWDQLSKMLWLVLLQQNPKRDLRLK